MAADVQEDSRVRSDRENGASGRQRSPVHEYGEGRDRLACESLDLADFSIDEVRLSRIRRIDET